MKMKIIAIDEIKNKVDILDEYVLNHSIFLARKYMTRENTLDFDGFEANIKLLMKVLKVPEPAVIGHQNEAFNLDDDENDSFRSTKEKIQT